MTKVSARERAREAKARRDAERVARDKEILAAAQSFYEASDAAETARDALEEAESAKAQVIEQLGTLGEQTAAIAQLCSISESEVRALRKRTKSTSKDRTDEEPAQ